jgi:hypothetical protein
MGNGSGTFACQVTFFSPQADSVKIAEENDLSAADVEEPDREGNRKAQLTQSRQFDCLRRLSTFVLDFAVHSRRRPRLMVLL